MNELWPQGIMDVTSCCFKLLAVALLIFLVRLAYLSLQAYHILKTRAKLPVVFWVPSFWRIDAAQQKGGSLKRILPRMSRLGGPRGVYGTVYGGQAVIHIADPEAASVVLSQTSKAPAYDHFRIFCGHGVFTADGEEWKAKRQSVNHSLFRVGGRLDNLWHIVNEAADQICQHLMREQELESEVEMVGLLQRHTLAIIHEFITGTKLSRSIPQQKLTTEYIAAVTEIRMILLARARSAWMLTSQWIYRAFSNLHRRELLAMVPIRSFARVTIEAAGVRSKPLDVQSSKSSENKMAAPISTVSSLATLASRESHGAGTHNGDGPVGVDHMLDEAITLLFAGQDTSAATLSWTMFLLAQPKHYRIRVALKEEVERACGDEKIITPKVVGKLRLVDAVIKEAQRVYPVAPFVVRKLDADLQVPKSEAGPPLLLPRGALAIVWIYCLHHHPDLWDRPEEFRPERWLQKESTNETQPSPVHPPGAFIPFASGPRSCIGQPFAAISLRVLLARLCVAFNFELVGADSEESTIKSGEMQAGFTVMPFGGVTVKLRSWDA